MIDASEAKLRSLAASAELRKKKLKKSVDSMLGELDAGVRLSSGAGLTTASVTFRNPSAEAMRALHGQLRTLNYLVETTQCAKGTDIHHRVTLNW